MPKVIYVGPFDEVEGFFGVVKNGESVEVSADEAKALLEQADNWQASKKGDDK